MSGGGARRAAGGARAVAAAVALGLALASGPRVEAQGSPAEYEVKAAFLYNFAKFVEWPAAAFGSTTEPLVIGVLGDDPFGAVLDRTLEGRQVGGRPVVARRVASVEDAAGCHLLFVSASEAPRLPAILRGLAGRPVLTVGDLDRFAQKGGAIGFVMQDRKVRFEIDVGAAERAGIKISSQLLKLATTVRDDGRQK